MKKGDVMLTLHFQGWFQCRFATDPDAFDHPRGNHGWTFAVAGEPDLDRLIRLQNAVAPRSHGPTVGVAVTGVLVDGQAAPAHPLLAAPVELLDGAVFEGRNGLIATAAQEPIVPFHLRIARDSLVLQRLDPVDLTNPTDKRRRQPVEFEGQSPEVAAATGITDRQAFRDQRRTDLEHDLTSATDPTVRAALNQRIGELQVPGIAVASLGFKLTYRFQLSGPAQVADPANALGATVDTQLPWPIEYWMGGWDADALCGFMRGTLQVPASVSTGTTTSFARDIRPLFRDIDVQHMSFAFDLASYDDVKNNSAKILGRLRAETGGVMPPDAPWPADRINLFARWIQEGHLA
jgi:hypothetical protein